MNDLPEDLSQWPSNPYLLFNVGRDATTTDVRRVYVRLVKRFKPEQFPEHFRRIREAFETLQAWQAFPVSAEPHEEPDEPEAAEVAPMPRRRDDPWRRAQHGDLAAAYATFRQRIEADPSDDEAYLRLYWLLALAPELDRERPARAWLAKGLAQTKLQGPLRELYRRELLHHPEEGQEPRCRALLSCGASPGALLPFLTWRWHAASHFADWDQVIQRDLAQVRSTCIQEDEVSWARILLAALDLLVWVKGKVTREALPASRELGQMAHVHDRLAWDLDRRDLLFELAHGYHAAAEARTAPGEFLTIISVSWRRPLSEYRCRLVAFLGRLAADPAWGLQAFDQIAKASSALLAQFGHALDALAGELPAESVCRKSTDAGCMRAIEDFVFTHKWNGYPAFRTKALEFCLRECIAPEELAKGIEGDEQFRLTNEEHLADRMLGDWPLRMLCRSYLLFWA